MERKIEKAIKVGDMVEVVGNSYSGYEVGTIAKVISVLQPPYDILDQDIYRIVSENETRRAVLTQGLGHTKLDLKLIK